MEQLRRYQNLNGAKFFLSIMVILLVEVIVRLNGLLS